MDTLSRELFELNEEKREKRETLLPKSLIICCGAFLWVISFSVTQRLLEENVFSLMSKI